MSGASPDVFTKQIDDDTYIVRVFSPYNISKSDSRSLNVKYDYMVAISGPSGINKDE